MLQANFTNLWIVIGTYFLHWQSHVFLRISQVMKMTVSWGMCHCVYSGRCTVILEEYTASLFRAYINLSKEERWHSIGNNFGVEAPIGKKAVGRPRLQYLKQVARNKGTDSYTVIKRMGCDSSRWKAANQSQDWRIRRILNFTKNTRAVITSYITVCLVILWFW